MIRQNITFIPIWVFAETVGESGLEQPRTESVEQSQSLCGSYEVHCHHCFLFLKQYGKWN